MGTIASLQRRLKGINVANMASKSVDNTKQYYMFQNNLQLYDGKFNDGSDIHPNYLEDPYFKTQQQAIGYAKYKRRITPNPKRNFYTPNLFINGFYHDSRKIDVEGQRIIFNSDAQFASSIDIKYGPKLDGIYGKYKRLYVEIDLFPEFIKNFKSESGL